MATSLAEQLQRLAIPQTSTLKRDKKRPSLLFDPKEAATLTRETVYQIGLEGFQDLQKKSGLFSKFANTLFHVTSKEFERSVESTKANKKLDKAIQEFLLLLSPYFLLNSAHKALEWLINRFSIHEYNKDEFLMLILPYHETNIFVRALQIIPIKASNVKWLWLKPLQKPGIHLPKQTLYNHAAHDPSFIQLLSNFVLWAVKTHESPGLLSALFNFYCMTFTGCLDVLENVDESHISQMWNIIMKGCESNILDFCAGTYIIIAKLISKTEISMKLLHNLVQKISEIQVSSLKSEAVLLLVIIYQKQTQLTVITSKAVRKLASKIEWIPKYLQELNKANSLITPFLEKLFKASIKIILFERNSEECKQFVYRLLNEIKLDDDCVSNIINVIVDSCDKEENFMKGAQEWMKEFLSKIETQYPVVFDREVIQIMKTTDDAVLKKRQKCFEKLLALGDGHVVTFEKTYHPVAQVRKSAMRRFVKKYHLLTDREKEFARNTILDRLNDDNWEVVFETLDESTQILPKMFNINDLIRILIDLLKKCENYKGDWWQVSYSALLMLCNNAPGDDMTVFINILPFLLPTNEVEIVASKIIVDSPYLTKCKYLRFLVKHLKMTDSYKEFFAIVFDSLRTNSKKPDIKTMEACFKEMSPENTTILHKYIGTLLLCILLPENCSPLISSLVLNIIISYLDYSELEKVGGKQDIINYVAQARKNELPMRGFLHCIEILIHKTCVPDDELGLLDFDHEDEVGKFYILLLDVLLKGSEVDTACVEILKKFFERFFIDFTSKVEFLLNIAIGNNKFITSSLQLRSLGTVHSVLRKNPDAAYVIKSSEILFPYLLICLTNVHREIRSYAIKIICSIVNSLNNINYSYKLLLENIITNRKDIILDNNQVPIIIQNILLPQFYTLNKGTKLFKTILNSLIDMIFDEQFPTYFKAGITVLLSGINDIDVCNKMSRFGIEILEQSKNFKGEFDLEKSIAIFNTIKRFNIHIAPKLDINSDFLNFMELSLRNDESTVTYMDLTSNPSILIMDQIDKDVFENLNENVKISLLNIVTEVTTTTSNPEVSSAAYRMFKHIDLDANLVVEQLKKMRDVQSTKVNVTKRKRRRSTVPTADILDTLGWKKGVTILEFIQDKKKIKNTSVLLPILFDILKKCLDFDEQSSVEYPKQLILSTILNICSKEIECENLPETAFNVELIVQCIRVSQNPQTHHHALLVLANTASLIPTQVLHNVMAIFTFMGSSVLRHDDAYSFQIINKIIETIIPILIQDNSKDDVICVLRVFVDAILDVPEHRRNPLYTNLLKQVGPKNNLYHFLLLMFESHVLHANVEKQKSNKEISMANIKNITAPKRLDIAAELCQEFTADIVIKSCIKLMEYLRNLPQDKDDYMETNSSPLFDIKHRTPKQFRHYKYVIITFITNLLTSKEFVNKIASMPDEDLLLLEPLYKDMIINVLSYVETVVQASEKNVNTPQAQYWKVILHHTFDVLDSLNALLTPQMFLLVIRGLTTHHIKPVRRRALELLNSKLQHNSEFFSKCEDSELYAIIPSLINIIKQLESTDVNSDLELLIQTSLLSLKLFVKLLGKKNPEKFVSILEFITNLIKSEQAKGNILASTVLCLAELCSNLRAFAIPHLSKFMPIMIRLLKRHGRQESADLLLLSVVTAIQKIVDSLPLFLSPYLEKLMCGLSGVASKWNLDTDDPKLVPLVSKMKAIREKIGLSIPTRVLIPIIDQSYHTLVLKKQFSSIGPLMEILAESLSHVQSSEIQTNLPELTTFFLNALQFRAYRSTSHEDSNEIESYTLKALVTLILKLSESTFRPLYYKVYDWAIRSELANERVITFYALSSQIANSLKGLFVLFAGHFLNNAATLLDTCNVTKTEELYFDDENKNIMLVENILSTLHAVCLYDTQKFITKERFDVLMQPIVDQLENTLGDMEALISRAATLVIPCVVQFSVATGDDALWKQLNYQILLKMRHNSPSIRLIALNCLTELAKKLGNDFLPLLPETIPFLAELLEDEEETVEKACQKAVQDLEKVVGEPLQKYF